MARYLITYLDGEAEEVTANTLEPSSGQYIAYREGKPAAYVPAANVRSIIRQDDEAVDS
jgi:hypothetical protein